MEAKGAGKFHDFSLKKKLYPSKVTPCFAIEAISILRHIEYDSRLDSFSS